MAMALWHGVPSLSGPDGSAVCHLWASCEISNSELALPESPSVNKGSLRCMCVGDSDVSPFHKGYVLLSHVVCGLLS